jgi:nitroimidazol reductase NimA-like FMN-containing flavoprotein (pyridoxamine 5'-phosphate oxidase superfamily)
MMTSMLDTVMIDTMKDLLRAGDMCVLATCADGRPHCSLMAYLADDAATMVYMVTLKQTKKYRNFLQNPHASLLVDTRNEEHLTGQAGIRALTVEGTFQPVTEKIEKEHILGKMGAKHSHLKELLADEDVAPFAIKILSFLLLDGALDAHFITI